MTEFEDVFFANPAPAFAIAARSDIDQARIDAVNEELDFPSLQTLRRTRERETFPIIKELGNLNILKIKKLMAMSTNFILRSCLTRMV